MAKIFSHLLKTSNMRPIYPCLWFDGNAKEAAAYYCSVFRDSRIEDANPWGTIFRSSGEKFMCLNGGPQFNFNSSISFYVVCETEEEVNEYWTKLIEGGEEGRCGWLNDRFGVLWQVVPK